MVKQKESLCELCGYSNSQDHENWCFQLHPSYWSWFVEASSGSGNKRKAFYEGEQQDIVALISLFNSFIRDEKEHMAIGPFDLSITHRLHAPGMHQPLGMSWANYTIIFGSEREMGGNYRPQPSVVQAWQRAGGIWRKR